MIKEISIRKIATYNNTGVVFSGLKKINFFYGSNGSGKTSLSNAMKNIENFPDCNIDWASQPLKTWFITRNSLRKISIRILT